MSNTLSFAELDEQHVELLPARTVLSVLAPMGGRGNCNGHSNCNHINNHNTTTTTTTTNYAKAISINASPVIQVSGVNTGTLIQAASTSSTAVANAGH
jgi:hypothetical protein